MIRHVRKFGTSNVTVFVRNSFQKAFDKYLIWTNIASGGLLLVAGDLIQQEIEYRQKLIPKRYDYARMGRMFVVGMAQGPLHHYFYKYLDVFLPKQDMKSVGKKILVDQIIASPVFIFSFFYGMGFMENRNLHDIGQEMKDKFVTIYTADWLVWPPTQFINFYFVPPKYRVIYINFITMLYNVFLSYIKHKDQHNEQQISK